MIAHIIGIDPGLVHTGCVSMLFDPQSKDIIIEHEVIDGLDAVAIGKWADGQYPQLHSKRFIEGYRPRSNLNSDARMVAGVRTIQSVTNGKVLNNTGILQVVPTSVMLTLGVWKFSTPTHHQDLRSAARIGILGMLKDSKLNTLLADIIRDHIDGSPWAVTHH